MLSTVVESTLTPSNEFSASTVAEVTPLFEAPASAVAAAVIALDCACGVVAELYALIAAA